MSTPETHLYDTDDFYVSPGGDEYIYGNGGNDWLVGGGWGYQYIDGGEGNDTISGGLGNDVLEGGEGEDTVSYSYSHKGVTVDLVERYGKVDNNDIDSISNVENVIGTNYADTITGDNNSNKIWAMAGNDTVHGGNGSDWIDGGAGRDVVYGDNGTDTLIGGAGDDYLSGGLMSDVLHGGADNDTLVGGAGSDFLDGGAGFDTVSYSGSNAGVMIYMGTGGYGVWGDAEGDTFAGIEKISGSSFSDQFWGSNQSETFDGGLGADDIHATGGNDTLFGGVGDDFLHGNSGFDSLDGGAGADLLDGGTGTDTATYATSYAGVTINLSSTGPGAGGFAQGDTFIGVENIVGSTAVDFLTGNGENNRFDGGAGDDTLKGAGGNDALYGNAGNDQLEGGSGNDRLYGGGENDILLGGNGNDALWGGQGKDQISGGSGDDVFVFDSVWDSRAISSATRDIMIDFQQGHDHVDLAGLEANSVALTFYGAESFHGAAGELHYGFSGANTIVSADLNGDKIADFAIEAVGHITFAASDFVL